MIKKHKAKSINGSKILVTLVDMDKSMEFNCSMRQYEEGIDAYIEGALIQNAFPFLTAGEREFLLSGLTPEEFAKEFPDE